MLEESASKTNDESTAGKGCAKGCGCAIAFFLGIPIALSILASLIPEPPMCSESNAIFHSQLFVKSRLKSPSSAVFPLTEFKVQSLPSCQFVVSSWVESQNSFGAQIRSNYLVVLKGNESTKEWELIEIGID